MKITILGTRGEIEATAPRHSKHSGVLVDDLLLFDVGEPVFLERNPDAVFITHLHLDHAYFTRHHESVPKMTAVFYAPEPYPAEGKSQMKVLDAPFAWNGYTITPIPTEHSLKVKSQAYVIEKSGVSVLYTGDLFWIEKKYHHLFGQFDLVITDGSYLKEGGMIRRSKTCSHEDGVAECSTTEPFGHTGIPDLIRFFAPYTQRILFVHFGSWFYKAGAHDARAAIENLGRQYGVETLVGYDGMQVTIDKKGVR